jgi:hypothetical protein
MKTIAVILVSCSMIFIFSCGEKKHDSDVPESFLSHVDIVLDTGTVRALHSDNFITTIFGMPLLDTITMMGRPSYDFFILGQESYLHISEARGFYQSQSGGVSVIIQSKKPGMLDPLMAAWKKHATYAIEVNTSSSPGFTLHEVFPVIGWTNIQHPRLTPILTTYSPETYTKWGMGDSLQTGVGMKTYMQNWCGEDISRFLFKKIDEIYLNATEREKEILIPIKIAQKFSLIRKEATIFRALTK